MYTRTFQNIIGAGALSPPQGKQHKKHAHAELYDVMIDYLFLFLNISSLINQESRREIVC